LTPRALIVCLVSLLLMGVWVEYEELYNTYGGPLAENSPANSAVGVLLVALGISAALGWLRRRLRLATAELVVIYAALIMAAPLMSQGLWHRFFGLVTAVPHNADFKSYESLPPMLWPHGPNLLPNGRFEHGLEGYAAEGGQPDWDWVAWRERKWRVPVLDNRGQTNTSAALAFTLPASAVVPGEKFLFSGLVRTRGFAGQSAYLVTLRADEAPPITLLTGSDATRPSFALPSGLQRVGVSPVVIPPALTNRLVLAISLRGQGTLAVHDLQFFNVEAVEGLFAGRQEVRQSRLGALPRSERNFTLVRPDNLFSLAGLRYLVSGGIPLRAWLQPALAWTILIGALFAGFFGLNVLMRKQWVEHERFTFPLTILPKRLLHDEHGRLTIFRNRIMWAGFAAAFVVAIWKGLCFYHPSLPAIGFGSGSLADYVENPVLQAFLSEVKWDGIGLGLGLSVCLLAVMLLIETDVLLSLWLTFFVFQLWRAFGKAFNLTRYAGYPWEHQQTMGGFLAFALLALFVGRHHLARVFRLIAGRFAPAERSEAWTYRGALLLLIAALATIVGWSVWTNMGVTAGLFFFSYMLACGFAASKIRAEMGAPLGYLTPYYGMQFVAAIGGFAVFHSTGMLVATIAAGFMCTSCFLLIAPAQIEMMELGRHFNVRPRDIGAGLTLGLLGGLFIGGFVLLSWAYGLGADNLKTGWPYGLNWYFDGFRNGEINADRAFEFGTLGQSPEGQALNIIHNPDAKGLAVGAGITFALAGLRSLFTWFPIHPLGYVLASTYFMKGIWYFAVLAWAVRLSLFRLGGARTIREGLVPFCVGMFLAGIVSIFVFDLTGILLRMTGVVEVYSKMP
jgi:hypothetical protein